MLLAIDTSNDYAGVALWDERGLRAEATWHAGRQHTEQVLPQIDLLLRHIGASPGGLTAIAVATGPGSWSGLRAGMSLAKALAVGRNLPLVGVAALDALAYGSRGALPVLAVIRLGRDRYGTATYADEPDGWRRVSGFEARAGAEVAELVHEHLVVGDIPPELSQLRDMPAQLRLSPPTARQRRAPFVAELAWMRHTRGDYDSLVALEPIYLGSPVRGES